MGKDWGRPKGPTARRRATRNRRLKADERSNKAEVRRRDGEGVNILAGACRFPSCGCRRLHVGIPGTREFVEVSHLSHKGMGGDPTGERSTPDKMICLCNWRHKAGRISVDQGTLQCRPMTDGGTNGPVAWWIDAEVLINLTLNERGVFLAARPIDGWLELAREAAPGVLEPLTLAQSEALTFLAEMEF